MSGQNRAPWSIPRTRGHRGSLFVVETGYSAKRQRLLSARAINTDEIDFERDECYCFILSLASV
jgi:hypothetical protein